MIQTEATVVSVSNPVKGLQRKTGRSIDYSFIITFHCPDITNEALPGQFVMIKCGNDEHILPRPFSINRASDGNLSLYVAVLENGTGTGWLAERKSGDTVKMLGPVGNGFPLDSRDKNILLMGGGMGIAPLIFLAQYASEREIGVTILYGTPSSDRYPLEEAVPGSTVRIVTEDGSEGHKGLVTDIVSDYIENSDHVYICGPSGMYEYIFKNRQTLLIDTPTSVSLETRMACGRGICYGCTIQTTNGLRRVCEHGPVFNLEELVF